MNIPDATAGTHTLAGPVRVFTTDRKITPCSA
jgi:hypothetical protein